MSFDSEQSPACAYDEVPYQDFPYAFSHPRTLETMAVLFGMTPTPISQCRVLEIGCAGGGNLIPQAVEFPESSFLGIDLSERQIAGGRAMVQSLGLKNIEMRQANILDIDSTWGQFDYIISHGVFSWLPPAVQDRLLAVSSRNLAPQGVAFVSYNTYPGWHLSNVVREVMLYHVRQLADPKDKIEQAMAILECLAELSSDENSMGRLLREELDKLRAMNNASYLFHEYLEADNHPLYFHEFIQRAEAQGLQYLGEPELSSMLMRNMPEKARAMFQSLPLLAQEQYMDFVRGRRFRRTLLCHGEIPLARHIAPEKMRQFHFWLTSLPEAAAVDVSNENECEFAIRGASLTTASRLVKAAMLCMREVYPRPISFAQLYAASLARVQACRPVSPSDPSMAPSVLSGALLVAYTVNLARICVHPPHWAAEITGQPTAGPLARLQAARSKRVTNQRHESVAVNPLSRRLLLRLDGRHDRQSLAQCVHEAITAGELKLESQGRAIEKPDASVVSSVVEKALSEICAAGLLVS